MKKFNLLLLVLLMAVLSCSKDENTGAAGSGSGKIRFTCTSSNPYYIKIDDVAKGTIQGNSFMNMVLPVGAHHAYMLQVSGYLFTPTEVNYYFTMTDGGDTEYIFPSK